MLKAKNNRYGQKGIFQIQQKYIIKYFFQTNIKINFHIRFLKKRCLISLQQKKKTVAADSSRESIIERKQEIGKMRHISITVSLLFYYPFARGFPFVS